MKKWVAILSIFVMLFQITKYMVEPIKTFAAVVGRAGSIPSGGNTGAGGGVNLNTVYRVGLISEKTVEANKFNPTDTNNKIAGKIVDHFSNHFPDSNDYVMFAPSANFTTDAVIGKYTPSSGTLDYIGKDDTYFSHKVRELGSTKDNNGVYYNKLLAKAPTMKDLSKLSKGKWRDALTSDLTDDSKNVWNYILQSSSGMVTRLKDYTDDDLADDGNEKNQYKAQLKYLDLMLSLYVLLDPKDRGPVYEKIERYVGDRESLVQQPVLLYIDTAARFGVPAYLGSSKLFVPSIDFVQWAQGNTAKQDITKPNFYAGSAEKDTKKIITASANKSIDEAPRRQRITDLTGSSRSNNGFAYGYSGVVGDFITTETGKGNWHTSSVTGIMQSLTFTGAQFGFVIQGGPQNKSIPRDCDCTSKFSIDKTKLKQSVDSTSSVIGQKVNLMVDGKQTDTQYKKWLAFMQDKDLNSLKMKVDLVRYKPSAGTFTKIGDAPGDGTFTSITWGTLRNFLNGSKKFSYENDLTSHAINEGQTLKFEYNVTTTITGKTKTGEVFTITCVKGKNQLISFTRGKPGSSAGTGNYTSIPKYWSEIKEGSPGNETFEAMAGTPTTRNLYLAAGGSEFIVDIEVEYVSDATATRTYTSKFNSVINGWAMSPITGSTSHNSPPSAPAPRSKTDSGGNSYTETVSLHSSKHVTKPAVPCSGTPCVGGSPEESHTDYWYTQDGYPPTLVGGYSDTWTQTAKFDYMKINNVHVWQLTKSKITGMEELTGTDEFTANIVSGKPSIFANMDSTNTSAGGRLRYSLEPDQHDNVVWNEGPSDDVNPGVNSKDSGPVKESDKFKERRNLTTNVTTVSDFLILQTSQGDKSVLYFDKNSPTVKIVDTLTVPKTSFDTMWTNNPNSAAKWKPEDIPIGSYNGEFRNTNSKYSSYSPNTVNTIFDSLPAGKNRPSSPSTAMRLYNPNIDIIDNHSNGEYITGDSTVFYELLSFNKGTTDAYPIDSSNSFGLPGMEDLANYSDDHGKVNDIVVHNPVSNENAMIVSLPSWRDQRTNDTKLLGGNLQAPTVDYEKRLKPGYVFTPTPPTYGEVEIPNPDYDKYTGPSTPETFNYTGDIQEYTATRTGKYSLELWGAEGGRTLLNVSSNYGSPGRGGYSKGTIDLNAGDILYLYVGGKGNAGASGGWNGGGSGYSGDPSTTSSGGGATDIRKGGKSLSNRIIVAGGGGGTEYDGQDISLRSGDGGGNSGSDGLGNQGAEYTVCASKGGTQSSGGNAGNCSGGQKNNGTLGQGGDSGTMHSGAGGGGYYGGGNGDTNGGGGGGSGYTGGVSDSSMTNGVRSGDGKISITPPSVPPDNIPKTIKVISMTDPGQTEPPEDAYEYIPIITDPNKPAVDPILGTFIPGNFINLDYGFQLYYPNTGDFYGDGSYGIATTTEFRGKGFYNGMDTTEWVKSKEVKLEFEVLYNGQLYEANTWISLQVNQDSFNFYVPLADREAMSALVEFRTIANNAEYLDNDLSTNKSRYIGLAAKHGSYKATNIDVVGRIGNLVLEDTGDFRFSNLFKQATVPIKWLVEGVVKKVDLGRQNRIVGDIRDIRGESVSDDTKYLNTYGSLSHMQQEPIPLALSPEKNNITSLRKQPIRLGYNVFADVQTIGNYYSNMQIIPYYYHLNLVNGAITPVDVYMDVNDYYKAINKHDYVQPGWDVSSIYQFIYNLNWTEESSRRNYTEDKITDNVIEFTKEQQEDGTITKMDKPYGSQYPFGTAQIMQLKERNRTFVGSSKTYEKDMNPGDIIPEEKFGMQGQRWHFTYGLPSSAVVVPKGQQPTQNNIDALRNKNSVILMGADIKAVGDTYALTYSIAGGNNTVDIAGTSWDISTIPYPILTVYSANKSSADDLEVVGTH